MRTLMAISMALGIVALSGCRGDCGPVCEAPAPRISTVAACDTYVPPPPAPIVRPVATQANYCPPPPAPGFGI